MQDTKRDRMLRLPQLEEKTGLCRSGIYDRINPRSPRFDASFPRPVKLGARAVAFSEREIDEWLAARMAARDRAAA